MDVKGVAATAAGIVGIIAFAAAWIYAANQLAADQSQWDRLIYLFSSVEAIALAAFGYFFGKEVNRARAEEAEKKNVEAAEVERVAIGAAATARARLEALVQAIDMQKPYAAKRRVAIDELVHDFNKSHDPAIAASIQAKVADNDGSTADQWEQLSRYAHSLADGR